MKFGKLLLASAAVVLPLMATPSYVAQINKGFKQETLDAARYVKFISPATLHKWMQENRNFTIIDVREKSETTAMQIDWPSTDLIPRGVLEDKIHEDVNINPNTFNPNHVYVMVCRTGHRATLAGAVLVKYFHFKHVYVLKGGILGWLKAGYHVIDGRYFLPLKLVRKR
jgi:rhodanese-related sulfurtransferase